MAANRSNDMTSWIYRSQVLKVFPIHEGDTIDPGHLGPTIHSYAGAIIDYYPDDNDENAWLVEVPTVIEAICLFTCRRLRDGTEVAFTFYRAIITHEWEIDDFQIPDLNFNRH